MWKFLTFALLLIFVSSSQALDCMYCNSTSASPDLDCENKLSTSFCTGATSCIFSFGHHTYNTWINQEMGPTVRDSYTMRNCLYTPVDQCGTVVAPIPTIPGSAITSSVGGGCWMCDTFNMCNSARKVEIGMWSALLLAFLASISLINK